jgi:hypothetical protein
MTSLLLALLERLEAIGEQHPELGDSDVRQMIGDAVMDGFVLADQNYLLSADFGMRTAEGNESVRAALDDYIRSATIAAKGSGNSEFHERLNTVQDQSVLTGTGRDYEDYLGHRAPGLYDKSRRHG